MSAWEVVASAAISGSTMSASIASFSYLAAASPVRPVELSNVTRHWWIEEFFADGSSKRFLDDTKDGFEILDEAVSLGDLIYAPPDLLDDEHRTAYERVVFERNRPNLSGLGRSAARVRSQQATSRRLCGPRSVPVVEEEGVERDAGARPERHRTRSEKCERGRSAGLQCRSDAGTGVVRAAGCRARHVGAHGGQC